MGQDYIQQQKIFLNGSAVSCVSMKWVSKKSKFGLISLLAGCATVAANKLGYL